MYIIEIIALLAVSQLFVFGALVGSQRRVSGIDAPTMTGHVGLERMIRVHMNTLEIIVPFLVGLLIAGKFWSVWIVAPIGVIYLVGRIIYWRTYMANPAGRTVGFVMSVFPIAALVILGLLGAIIG